MIAKEILSKLTLMEKAALLSGKNEWESRDIPRLGIQSISFADGPHGVRRQEGAGDHLGLNASLPATCFPTAATVANSWDPSLGEEIGRALGEEAVAQKGIDAEIEYITDMSKIMEFGIMSTPALMVDNKVVSMGHVLKAKDIAKML